MKRAHQMTLGELIYELKKYDPKTKLGLGFGSPDSYRGYYEQLSFEPKENVTIGEMLKHAESAVNKTFQGYKSGDYVMTNDTECWLADCDQGWDGETLGYLMLELMVRNRLAD